jgi:broad specificity phosphatase PhoE
MQRAERTAAAVSATCNLETRLDRRLIEGSFGDWEGLKRSDVMQLSPKDAALIERWESDPACSPPGGESMRDVQKRALELIQELENDLLGSSVVLVSHVGPIKSLLAAALDIPLQASRHLFLDPCTISVIDWGARPIVRLFNSHEHLGWSAARWMQT